jgi:hypothetical protein
VLQGFKTPLASVVAPGDASGQDDASTSWWTTFSTPRILPEEVATTPTNQVTNMCDSCWTVFDLELCQCWCQKQCECWIMTILCYRCWTMCDGWTTCDVAMCLWMYWCLRMWIDVCLCNCECVVAHEWPLRPLTVINVDDLLWQSDIVYFRRWAPEIVLFPTHYDRGMTAVGYKWAAVGNK